MKIRLASSAAVRVNTKAHCGNCAAARRTRVLTEDKRSCLIRRKLLWLQRKNVRAASRQNNMSPKLVIAVRVSG